MIAVVVTNTKRPLNGKRDRSVLSGKLLLGRLIGNTIFPYTELETQQGAASPLQSRSNRYCRATNILLGEEAPLTSYGGQNEGSDMQPLDIRLAE